LQAVDGDISIKEAQQLISKYYESKTDHDSDKDDTEEADKVVGAKFLDQQPRLNVKLNVKLSGRDIESFVR
jgi:hypothetical protein